MPLILLIFIILICIIYIFHLVDSSCYPVKYAYNHYSLTPWLMEPGGSMPHPQGLPNNPCPEPNQPNSPH